MKREHLTNLSSPFTGGRVIEVSDIEQKEFRKEKYSVHVRYYRCEDTGEQYTTGDQDELFCNDLYNQYRVRHGIPFPDEIRDIRERYGLNYTQISKIMGFGLNQWRQYEEGSIPNDSNARLIIAVKNKNVMKGMLEAAKEEFDDKEYLKLSDRINKTTDKSDSYENRLLFGKISRGILNGYAPMDAQKVKMMVEYLIDKEGGSICPTKLNKEMFYSDFLHFRNYGVSISGLSYRAIQYGPVPSHFDTIYDNLEDIVKEHVIISDNESVKLHLADDWSLKEGLFSHKELSTMERVSALLRPLSVSEVVKISHEESAWDDNVQNHGLIPYSYAFELKYGV